VTSGEVSELAERVHRRVTEAHAVCVMTNCTLRALWVGDVQEILDAAAAETADRVAQLEAELAEMYEARKSALDLWRMSIHGVTSLADLPPRLLPRRGES
jgi:site-specific recombinase